MLYIAGPTVSVACLVLPHSPQTDETSIWIMAVVAYSMVPVLFTQYRRLPPIAVSAIIVLANTLVTAIVYFNHEASSYYAFIYLWGTPYAAIFFGARHAAAHLAYPAVAYAVVLGVHANDGNGVPGGAEIGHWLQLVAAMAVTVLLVRALSRALADSQADRHRRALEINDDVVQRLVVARHAYAAGDDAEGAASVDAALDRARAIMADLVGSDTIAPGSLRRERAATDDA
jgi:hypothetical protein